MLAYLLPFAIVKRYFLLECSCQLRGITLAIAIFITWVIFTGIEVTLGLIQVLSTTEHKRDATLSLGNVEDDME